MENVSWFGVRVGDMERAGTDTQQRIERLEFDLNETTKTLQVRTCSLWRKLGNFSTESGGSCGSMLKLQGWCCSLAGGQAKVRPEHARVKYQELSRWLSLVSSQ